MCCKVVICLKMLTEYQSRPSLEKRSLMWMYAVHCVLKHVSSSVKGTFSTSNPGNNAQHTDLGKAINDHGIYLSSK